MIGIGIPEEAIEDVLVSMAHHLPPDVEIGQPMIARPEDDGSVQLATTVAWWWLEPGGTVARLLPLDEHRAELTRWADGAEVMRTLNID